MLGNQQGQELIDRVEEEAEQMVEQALIGTTKIMKIKKNAYEN